MSGRLDVEDLKAKRLWAVCLGLFVAGVFLMECIARPASGHLDIVKQMGHQKSGAVREVNLEGGAAKHRRRSATAQRSLAQSFNSAVGGSSARSFCPEMHALAEGGLPTAQYDLGEMYRLGHGVEKDGEKAAYWLRKAEEGFRRQRVRSG